MRTVDVVAGFAGCRALASVVAFVDDGMVEDVAAEGEVEMFDGPLLEGSRFEGGKVVDCDGNG